MEVFTRGMISSGVEKSTQWKVFIDTPSLSVKLIVERFDLEEKTTTESGSTPEFTGTEMILEELTGLQFDV